MDRAVHALDPSHTMMMVWETVDSEAGRPFLIPVAGVATGLALLAAPRTKTVGKLILYFGAQSFMNIYMSWLLHTSVTLPAGTVIPATNATLETNLTGCPAGFALTAMQQLISFVIFVVGIGCTACTPYRYTPKRISSWFEVGCLTTFGCTFALNIALNNFSLCYVSIALNLVMRSCLPVTTFLSQQGLAMVGLYPVEKRMLREVGLMVVGVVCACAFVVAKILGSASGAGAGDSANVLLGVCTCLASMLCGSLNMALAGVLGKKNELNPLDTVAYMSIPAVVFLLPLAVFVRKPVPGEWPKVFGMSHMSDFEILQGVWALNKSTIAWLALSGVFSLLYNIVQFTVVQTLSPAATCLGGNFNKAALIFLTLTLPFLRAHNLPGAPYIQVIWASVIVNITSFGYYSYLQIKGHEDAEAGFRPVEAPEDATEIAGGKAALLPVSPSTDSPDECESTTDRSSGASANLFPFSP